MKNYLMTWYGMTDLRASLKLEQTQGPVLGALLDGDYTDAIVLCFTNRDKTKDVADNFEQRFGEIDNFDPTTAKQFLDEFSNTDEAHNHFNKWLKEQLRIAGKNAEMSFRPIVLKHLNDTEGIYEAAAKSLNEAANLQGEKSATLHLSPGTPVMAFVWAFAALRHPNLKKRLIASSQPELPPEEIILPNEWMQWHGRRVETINTDPYRQDVVFHLFGEQRIPSLLGVISFSASKHIFVTTEKYRADIMKQFLEGAQYEQVIVDPYDPENVRCAILDAIEKMPENTRIGFNLTGGTKLMFAGALAACGRANATAFYFESRNNQIIFLNDYKKFDVKLIPSVETFIKLNVNDLFISKRGHWDDMPERKSIERKNLTNELWQVRLKISKLYKELRKYNDDFKPFNLLKGKIHAKLSDDAKAQISIGDKKFEFEQWRDFAKYLSGGWFEEYTFMQLQPLVDLGLIKDMRIGLEVSFKELSDDKSSFSKQLKEKFETLYQEIDIVLTDGIRLYIIECKAGEVKSEHLEKLKNIVRYYGGSEGIPILAVSIPYYIKHSTLKKKIAESKNVQFALGDELLNKLKKIINPGGHQR